MWFKILQYVQVLLSLILETESRPRDGGSDEKKAEVMKSAAAELRKEGMLGGEGDPNSGLTLANVSDLVDDLVDLLNLTGAFSHAPKAVVTTTAPADPPPPPEV